MRRDPLDVLARLRGMERDAAQRALADAQAARRVAEATERRVQAALQAEAEAASPVDYAAWLPAARCARLGADAALRRAEAESEAARRALVSARAAAESVATLLASRRHAARRARLAAQQAMLDDLRR
jgi:hypothetical protein